MPTHCHLTVWLASSLLLFTGCSRDGGGSEGAGSGQAGRGNSAAVSAVHAAARALAEPEPSVNYVAAEMAGAIKVRTNSQALLYYDGYRVIFTTPGDRVTRVVFELTEARPSVDQLTNAFGAPKEVGRGMLYEYRAEATGSTIRILAEPVSKPATATSLVRRIVVEGARIR